MSGLAVIPAWVVPPPRQVRDAHRIACALAPQTVDARPVVAAMDWVTGGSPGPVSARPGEPTAAVVRSEMMLADALVAGGLALGDDVWDQLGVPPVEAVEVGADWARGVAAALAWLLGAQRQPPVPVPRRLEDGSTPTAEQLYEEAAATGRLVGPEERHAARLTAERTAARYRVLAELAASTR